CRRSVTTARCASTSTVGRFGSRSRSSATSPHSGTAAPAYPGGVSSSTFDRPGAVPTEAPDAGVPAHYGDPLREQRALDESAGWVDRSHRGVLRITGPDRHNWLHNLTTQH